MWVSPDERIRVSPQERRLLEPCGHSADEEGSRGRPAGRPHRVDRAPPCDERRGQCDGPRAEAEGVAVVSQPAVLDGRAHDRPADAKISIRGIDHEIIRAGNENPARRRPDLPAGPEHSPHSDDAAPAQRELYERALDERVLLVLPLEVRRVQADVPAPEMPLKSRDLLLQARIVPDDLVHAGQALGGA